jgi:hypothetical protein
MKTLRITVAFGELSHGADGLHRSFKPEIVRQEEITDLSGCVLAEEKEPEAAFALKRALWLLRRDKGCRDAS